MSTRLVARLLQNLRHTYVRSSAALALVALLLANLPPPVFCGETAASEKESGAGASAEDPSAAKPAADTSTNADKAAGSKSGHETGDKQAGPKSGHEAADNDPGPAAKPGEAASNSGAKGQSGEGATNSGSTEPQSAAPNGRSSGPVSSGATSTSRRDAPPQVTAVEMKISGSMCVACLHELEKALKEIPGVEKVKIQHPPDNYYEFFQAGQSTWARLNLSYDAAQVSLDGIKAVLKTKGYHVFKTIARTR